MSMKKLLESIDRISEAYLPPDHPWWNLPPAERLKKQREAEMERDRLDAEVWTKGLKLADPKKTDESAPDTKFVGGVHRRVEECGDDFVCMGAKVYVQGNEGGEPLTVTRIVDDHQVVVADDFGQRHTVMIRDLVPADNDASLTEELKAAFEDYVSNEKYDADHLYPAKSKKPSVDKPKQKTPKVIDPKVVSESEGLDADTQRLEQEIRDALENGDEYTARQYARMAPTPEAKKYLLGVIKKVMYAPVTESADMAKEMVTFGEAEFDTWQQYAEKEGYEVREAGNLPGSYAAFDADGCKVGTFMNKFDLPNGENVVGKLLISPSLDEGSDYNNPTDLDNEKFKAQHDAWRAAQAKKNASAKPKSVRDIPGFDRTPPGMDRTPPGLRRKAWNEDIAEGTDASSWYLEKKAAEKAAKSAEAKEYKQYGITARKHGGNDAYSWAVFINGRVMVNGLTSREVPYYKKMALKKAKEAQGVSEGFNGISVNIEPELDYDVVYVDINGKKYNFNYWYTDEKPTDELGFRKDIPHYLKREEWYNKLDFPTKMEVLHAVVQAELGNEPSEYQPTVGDEPLDEQGVNEGTNHRKESALRAKLPTNEGFTVTPGINRERYTDLSAEGLEGPFQMKNGKVLYYDKKAGQYYDRDTDMYVDYDDYQAMNEDMEDGDWGNTPFEAYGVKGMKNTPWRKIFKNGKQAAAWCEKFDAEIHGSRELDSDELARMQRPKASKDWKMNEDENLTELSRAALHRYMTAIDDELGTPKFEKKQRDQKKYQLAFNKSHLPDPKKVRVPATEGKAAKIEAMRKKIGELQEAVKAAKAKMGGKTLEETPIDQNVKPIPGQAQTPSQQAPAPAGTPTVAAQPGQPQAPAAGQPGGAPVAPPPGTPQPATGGAASAASTPAEQMKGLVQSLANDPAAAKQLGIKLGTVR